MGLTLAQSLRGDSAPSSQMGIATTSYMMAWKPKDTLEFLEHCHALGAAGIQSAINGDVTTIRARAEQYGMYIEAMVPMPKPHNKGEFEQALRDAQSVGAVALRAACLDTRRYESFHSYAAWLEHVEQSRASLAVARSILERYKIPLGLENHKDWTADELAALMHEFGTEYLGVCLDFGNNLSLLDDPFSAIDKLARYAVCVHLKDMATAPWKEGLLLSEVLLGDGYLDLPQAIAQVRQRRPQIRLSLEMITRDPLKVACREDKYWATFPKRDEQLLADALRFVNTHTSAKPLPVVSNLSHEQWVKAENDHVIACLQYGREQLAL